ncbi:MAG: 30S ribosome-binding factor RbfA, partial [Dermatophilaceae bacterium]
MADPARARKVADRIKVIVAEMLEWRTKDERLGFVTVTDVKVTGDLQQASVFYTVFGGEEDRERTAAALEANKGRIRSAVGKGLGIRLTPSLTFHLDSIPEGAAHLDELLVVTQRRDAELAQAAEGASFAGDADPYRTPHEPGDDGDGGEADRSEATQADGGEE